MTRILDRAGLLLLYFGIAWKDEQITSQARQPLHLSTSIFIVLMVLVCFFIATVYASSSDVTKASAATSSPSVRIPRCRKSSLTYPSPSSSRDSLVGMPSLFQPLSW